MNNIIQKISQYIYLISCLAIFSACQNSNTVTPKETPSIEVAILMPLTGIQAGLGSQYNELIKMGLKEGLNGNINVTSYDGSEEGHIQESMQKIIAKKTKIILGPINSPLTSSISAEAEQNDIIIVTMSNDPALASPSLYVFGHAPMKQLDMIINYYLDRRYENYIALLPAGKHSATVNKVLQELIVRKNATLVRSEFYAENQESIDKSMRVVSDSVDNLNEIVENTNKPIIFVSDDSKNLTQLFSSMSGYNLDKKAIVVGDNRADIDFAAPFDISFTGSLKKIDNDLSEKAQELEIKNLSYMHVIAYDLGKITAEYIGEKFNKEEFLAKINSAKIFSGFSGKINFVDSIAQRSYDVLRKENNGYSDITNAE